MTGISSISTASLSGTDPATLLLQQQQQAAAAAARKAALDAAAKSLNMSTADLQQQLGTGKSLKDVATSKGVDFSTVQSAVTTAVTPLLNQDVQSGALSSQQASRILARVTSADAPGKVGGHGHHGHHAGAPTAPIATADPNNDPSALASPTYSPAGSSTAQTAATGQVVDKTA